MAHPMDGEARSAFKRKLSELGGKGEYPPDRAEQIAGTPRGGGQGDSAQPPEEHWIGAPARQVSDKGNVRK